MDTSRDIGKFRLDKKLGEGGMGTVWRAYDTELGRVVAIKFLKSGDTDDLRRLRREAQAVAKLVHPNIVQIYEAHEDYIVMQFVDGTTADKLGPLVNRTFVRHAAEVIRDAAQAIHYAHQNGIVHRDVKPANIMVQKGHAFVTDFGLARQESVKTSFSVEGAVVGTPAYMSPEQADGRPDQIGPASDVYSLGATLYDMLTGKPPFSGAGVYDTIRKVVEEEPVHVRALNREIDRDLETIVMKCLRKNPRDRYRSAAALAEDLDRWLVGESVSARPPGLLERVARWISKPYRKAVVLVALAAVVSSGLLLLDREVSKRTTINRELDRLKILELTVKAREAANREDYALATRLVDEVLSKKPDDFDAMDIKGALLGRAGKSEEALHWMKLAHKARPTSNTERNIGLMLYKLGRWREALPWLAKTRTLIQPIETGLMYADCLDRTGSREGAIAVLRELQAQHPAYRANIESAIRETENRKRD